MSEFKVGDRVRALDCIEPMYEELAGDEGVIEEVTHLLKVRWDKDINSYTPYGNSHICLVEKTEVELIKEKAIPTHSVPLRVGDKVRVLSNSVEGGDIKGSTAKVHSLEAYSWDDSLEIIVTGRGCYSAYKNDLELIPTEADITVGSVWEIESSKHKFIIEDLDRPLSVRYLKDGSKDSAGIHWLLENAKLIHRGDEVVVGDCERLRIFRKSLSLEEVKGLYNNGTGKQTNKKEKKMKRAGKVIKEGMLVVDRDCTNHGKVVAIYPELNKATYEDIDGSDVHTVSIDRLYIPLEAPKPKPTKKKRKK